MLFDQMKTFKPTIFMIAMLISSLHTMAQNTVEKENSLERVLQMGLSNAILNFDTNAEPISPSVQSNNIFIKQVGSSNSINVRTTTANSQIELNQNGKGNNLSLNVTALSVIESIEQNGQNNFFAEYGNAPNINLERNISQNGNSHNLVIHGSNSLTENIRLNMTGNTQSIIIRNFK